MAPRSASPEEKLAPLRLRMRLVVFGSEVFQRNVRVPLSGGQARMSQEFLDRAQVGAAFQEMSRKTVAKRVGGQPAAGRQQQPNPFDQTLNISRAQAPSSHAHEDRHLAVVFRLRDGQAIPFLDIGGQRSGGKVSEGNDALLSALSENAQKLLRHIDVLVIQT